LQQQQQQQQEQQKNIVKILDSKIEHKAFDLLILYSVIEARWS